MQENYEAEPFLKRVLRVLLVAFVKWRSVIPHESHDTIFGFIRNP